MKPAPSIDSMYKLGRKQSRKKGILQQTAAMSLKLPQKLEEWQVLSLCYEGKTIKEPIATCGERSNLYLL